MDQRTDGSGEPAEDGNPDNQPDKEHGTPSRPGHEWLRLAAGRICARCRTVQAQGEFEDTPCPGAR